MLWVSLFILERKPIILATSPQWVLLLEEHVDDGMKSPHDKDRIVDVTVL